MNIKIIGAAFMVLVVYNVESVSLSSILTNPQVSFAWELGKGGHDEKEYNEDKDPGYKICMIGLLCTVSKISGEKVDTIDYIPQANSTPGPNGWGFITTNECYKHHDVDYV
ncbi:hypothetical protein BCR42DRAFT_398738 [Absidia repens]|uniref:Uncharacterized protein n=1 Tax=Absidia repens TaxID=90262 RepID=A0A1X2HWZ1_9FUNG|nr:hypothetical protein BCR42DRAFT_398738 [Absidia repens]